MRLCFTLEKKVFNAPSCLPMLCAGSGKPAELRCVTNALRWFIIVIKTYALLLVLLIGRGRFIVYPLVVLDDSLLSAKNDGIAWANRVHFSFDSKSL